MLRNPYKTCAKRLYHRIEKSLSPISGLYKPTLEPHRDELCLGKKQTAPRTRNARQPIQMSNYCKQIATNHGYMLNEKHTKTVPIEQQTTHTFENQMGPKHCKAPGRVRNETTHGNMNPAFGQWIKTRVATKPRMLKMNK